MGTLAVAFALAWGFVAAYLSRIGHHQRQLAVRLEALEEASREQRQGSGWKQAA